MSSSIILFCFWYCYVADELDPEEAKKLLHEAMEKGYVESQHVVIILVGIAGSGKSSFQCVVLDLLPDKERMSTGLAEAIRNISISRAITKSVKWQVVTPEEMLDMIADAIKVGVPQEPTEMPSTVAASLSTSAQSTILNDEVASRDLQASDDSAQYEPGLAANGSNPGAKELNFEFQDHDLLLQLIARSKGSGHLLDVNWVYIIDTGGQPQFLQLLPAFIKNVSSCVFYSARSESGRKAISEVL